MIFTDVKEAMYRLHLQVRSLFEPEKGGITFLGKYLPGYTALHPRRQ
jgi:hypothetical protein